jgi:hypothetical protein
MKLQLRTANKKNHRSKPTIKGSSKINNDFENTSRYNNNKKNKAKIIKITRAKNTP